MVLNRLLVTALGALGLGALATGPAIAQVEPGTQIPAPRLYGDISTCGGGTLSMASIGKGSMSLLGMGGLLDQAFDSDGNDANGIQMDYTQDAARIVTGTTGNESNGLVELLSLANCDNAVANNVSTARDIYNSYTSAKKSFEALEEPTAEDSAAYNTARMNKEDFAGDVYNEAYDQAARLSAANKAIMDYNALVGSTGTLAQLKDNVDPSSGTAATGGFDDIVINTVVDPGGTSRVAGTTYRVADFTLAPEDDDGNTLTGTALRNNINAQAAPVYGSGNTAGYRAIAGHNAADSADAITTALLRAVDVPDGARAAFNAAGVIQFQVANGTGAATTSVHARASTSIITLGHIAHELDRWETAVSSLAKVLQDAKDAGNLDTRTEEENLRRATLGRDHVQSELDRLTRVVRSQNLAVPVDAGTNLDYRVTILGSDPNSTDDDITYSNERDLVDAYLSSRSNIMAAANKVRSAISNLDTANRAVQARLKDPGNYLNQLVALREYQLAERQAEQEEAGGEDALQSFKDAVKAASAAVTTAKAQRTAHQSLTSEPGSTTSKLLDALLASEDPETDVLEDDDGQALLTAISDVDGKVSTLQGQLTDDEGNPIDLSNLGNAEEIAQLTTDVSGNSDDIMSLDTRVAENESDIGQIQTDLYGTTSGQHDGLAACDATGLLNVANCADARSRHNEADIADVNDKLMLKKEYIDNLADHIGVDPVTGEGTGEGGMSRIDMNAAAIDAEEKARMEADTALGGRIDAEAMARADADMELGLRIDGEAMARAEADLMLGGMIMDEETARMEADTMLGGMIAAEEMARMEADTALGGRISSNADAIASNMNSIGQNASAISDNRNMIGELSDDLDVVRAGVAASMALAGMPAINGRGIAIGVGSYDGESAFAVGFQIQGEQASFKIGVTSSGGETGASAGVGFNF